MTSSLPKSPPSILRDVHLDLLATKTSLWKIDLYMIEKMLARLRKIMASVGLGETTRIVKRTLAI